MKLKVFCLVMAIGLLFLMPGCGPSSSTPTPTPKPACDPTALVAPVRNAPPQWGVLGSLTPTLMWKYPEACDPTGYILHFAMGPLYTPELGETLGNVNSWTPSTPLQPGKVYEWRVYAVSGATTGPASFRGIFFTGPQCTAAVMTAPALFEPADGSTLTTLLPMLKWDSTGGCLPTGYRVQVAADEAFTAIIESDDFTMPLNRAIWDVPSPFTDCTRYYWHVAQLVDGDVGPFSETWSYRTDTTGTCAPETPASVSGKVFHDQCTVPPGTTPIPSPLPDGCAVDDFGVVHADGIRQPGEPGIANIEVYLGPGDCPSTGLATAITDADGNFSFTGLTPGKYCLSSTANEGSANAVLLLPGRWTLVPSGHEGNTYRALTLTSGAALVDQDFGWDYANLPLVFPKIKLKINANCHIGPGLEYASPAFGKAGESYPIEGISADYLWYYVNFDGTLHCWFGKGAGETSGDLSQLPLGPMPENPQAACSTHTDQKSCISDSACKWVSANTRAPFCTNK